MTSARFPFLVVAVGDQRHVLPVAARAGQRQRGDPVPGLSTLIW